MTLDEHRDLIANIIYDSRSPTTVYTPAFCEQLAEKLISGLDAAGYTITARPAPTAVAEIHLADPLQRLVMHARMLAIAWHADQTDKAGRAYIRHPQRVAAEFHGADSKAEAVAWLHDVLEDTGMPVDLLRTNLAGWPEVFNAVLAITHRQHEPLDDYYARVKADPLALKVKLADLDDNMDPLRLSLLNPDTRDRLTAKYIHAQEVLTS